MNKYYGIIMVLIIASLGAWFLTINMPVKMDKEIWHCPMHLHYRSDRPGRCGICSMDLVKQIATAFQQHEKGEQGGSSWQAMCQ